MVSDRGGGRKRGGAAELSRDDCLCPVCLEIFMEPVTLPCTHSFCKVCFLESVDKATLCCPLCRKRVSTWARLHSRTNTLVDQNLWTRIQTAFPLQCQRRLNGQDAEPDGPGVSVCFPRVSEPGELKQEYEEQVTKLTEEKRALDEEEARASQELIQKLLAEEQKMVQEEMKRREEDERLARLLSSQLNSGPVSQENSGPVNATPAKKRKKEVSGQMDRFLCPLPSNSMFTANKVDQPLPKLDYYGAVTEPPSHRPAPPPLSVEEDLQLPAAGRPGSKRKSSELEAVCPSSSSSALQEVSEGGLSDWGVRLGGAAPEQTAAGGAGPAAGPAAPETAGPGGETEGYEPKQRLLRPVPAPPKPLQTDLLQCLSHHPYSLLHPFICKDYNLCKDYNICKDYKLCKDYNLCKDYSVQQPQQQQQRQ
ncbi:hypothetical protein PFLUV_G00016040 [Perca fluviatilis]|uniref:RING-type E3 ubiquitin transferase n=1 Tax=Perca fluviatilis TaxID=8168 RepID=A0A6A5EV29_PERFL|nr:E3 ubiquitin-protein ligase rnf168 [Perca fluviatilis]KAF1393467.1 hypothetical protein PFLUV_G00016040 [Perca fluviatilis]